MWKWAQGANMFQKFPRAKVKISPWTKVKFWGLARTQCQWLAQRCNNLHLPSGFLQISNFVPKERSFPTCTNYLLFLAKGWKVRLPVGSTCGGTGTTRISLFFPKPQLPCISKILLHICNYANTPFTVLYCPIKLYFHFHRAHILFHKGSHGHSN